MYKNPKHEDIRNNHNKYSIRKMTAGVASVIVGSMLLFANTANAQDVNISEDEALDIALDAAGVDSIGYMDDFELDSDDGQLYYEFEFVTDGVEYDFEIDAATGDVLDLDIDGADVQANDTGAQESGVDGTGTQDDGAEETVVQETIVQDDDYYDDDNGETGYADSQYDKKAKSDTLGHYEAYVHGEFGEKFVAKGKTVPHGYVKVTVANGEVYETNADSDGNFKLHLSELKKWDNVSVYFADKYGNDADLDITIKPYDDKDKDKGDYKKKGKDYNGKKAGSSHK